MGTQDSNRNRLFLVGCSFTKYVSPTYGDYLGADFKQTYNCAKSGAGNEYIFQTAAHIFDKFKPTKDDLVIIQWSGLGRWDHIFYPDMSYTTPGSLDWQEHYSPEIVDKYFNIVNQAFKLINYATAIKSVSKNYESKFATFNMLDPWIDTFFGEPYQTHIFNKHFEYIKEWYPRTKLEETFKKIKALQSIEEFTWSYPLERPLYYWDPDGRQDETHPSPTQHLKYAKYVNESLNLNCKNLYSDQLKEFSTIAENIYSLPEIDKQKIKDKEYEGSEYFIDHIDHNLQVSDKLFPSFKFGNKWEHYRNSYSEWMV